MDITTEETLVAAARSRPAMLPHRRRCALAMAGVLLAAGATYLLGCAAVSLWDCDEPWYAQASRQMLRSGDWVVPRFLERARTAKPIMIYWCQAAAMRVLGDTALAARLPSLLAVLGVAALIGVGAARVVGPRRAAYAVLVFATAGLVMNTAVTAATDGVLLLFVALAQACIFVIYRGTRVQSTGFSLLERQRPQKQAKACTLNWVFIGLAGLTKGPFVLVVLFCTLLALAALDVGREWRKPSAWRRAAAWWPALHPLRGLLIVAAIALPWLILAWRRDPAFLRALLYEPIAHARTNQSGGHPSWPGYHLVAIWLVFFPWSLLLPMTLIYAWRHRRSPAVRFALAAMLGTWVFVEFVMVTKLPHYLLPAYPSLAILAGCAIARATRRTPGARASTPAREFVVQASWERGRPRPHASQGHAGEDARAPRTPAPLRVPRRTSGRAALLAGAVLWSAAAAAMSLACWLPAGDFASVPRAAAAAVSIAGVAYALAVPVLLLTRRLRAAVLTMGLGILAVASLIEGLYLPRAAFLRVPELAGRALRDAGAMGQGQAIMVGIHEHDPAEYHGGFSSPALAFYQGGTIREREDDYLLKTDPRDWPQWVVVTDVVYDALPPDRRARLRTIAAFRGVNYNIPFGNVEVRVCRRE